MVVINLQGQKTREVRLVVLDRTGESLIKRAFLCALEAAAATASSGILTAPSEYALMPLGGLPSTLDGMLARLGPASL